MTATRRDASPEPDPEPATAPGPPPSRVPVTDLIELDQLRSDGRTPTPREIRAALPRGWLLETHNVTARRDLRLFFREGWILIVGLVLFGGMGLAFFAQVLPRGGRGLLRFGLLIAVVAATAGFVAPIVTRALYRRR